MDKPTRKGCHDEIVRLLNLLFYSKTNETDKNNINQSLKIELGTLARLEDKARAEADQRKVDREARKYGIKR